MEGFVLGVCSRFNSSIFYSFAVEALACLQGMHFAIDIGFQCVILEGDSRAIVTKLNKAQRWSQPNEADMFVGWFTDQPENFGNAACQRVSGPLDLNISYSHGLSLISNQETLPQKSLTLQE
ncbi:hypothetical protein J1N35_036973 [Gossypium stocksii]|uniref:RNase H type-1 domain-containing protein n=1 Tax=Gossypium stocksii TaxID=47602 RepID=A0A9D3ZL95_9ROSI|nr:hypothetical protein J1N35_036973 [Gossypium stocksii]